LGHHRLDRRGRLRQDLDLLLEIPDPRPRGSQLGLFCQRHAGLDPAVGQLAAAPPVQARLGDPE